MAKNEVMERLRKEFNGRLSRCESYDANVCHRRVEASRPWEPIILSGEPFDQALRFTYRSRKIKFFSSSMYLNGAIEGTFAIGVFSINEKSKIGFRSEFAGECGSLGQGWPIFTEDGKISTNQRGLLDRPEFTSILNVAALQAGDSIHFSNGDISFYLMNPDTDRVRSMIEVAIDLAQAIEMVEPEVDLRSLPGRFHSLIPLIEKWAVANDSDRGDLIDTTPDSTLRRVVESVAPYIPEIDAYLDRRGGPPDDSAAALGCLAEFVIEAKQKLAGAPESR